MAHLNRLLKWRIPVPHVCGDEPVNLSAAYARENRSLRVWG